MLEVVSLLLVLVMSLIITRVATVALSLTGMSEQAARFQARSALTGAGFTTSESEHVLNHPVRRRIIMALMLIGNTGIVLGASLMVMLLAVGEHETSGSRGLQLGVVVGGAAALYAAARSAWLERALGRFIERVLERHTDLPGRDFANLLRLGGEYHVVELNVAEGDWIAERPLRELELSREGVLVLGVTRADGTYVGAAHGDTTMAPGDVVMLYGRESAIAALDDRRQGTGGQLSHNEAVARQKAIESEESDDAPTHDASNDNPYSG